MRVPQWSTAGLALTLAALALALGVCGLSAGSDGWSPDWARDGWIVEAIRAPRTLGAFCTGALLGLAGALAQGVFRNALAEPYLLGSASGATLAIVATLVVGHRAGVLLGPMPVQWLLRLGLVGAAFAGAIGGVTLTFALARGAQRPVALLLTGVVVGVLLGAVANLLMLLSPDAMSATQVFLIGTTGFLGWRSLWPLAGTLAIGLPLALRYARVLDALVLGESTATSLGVHVPRMRVALIAVMALCTGTAVAQTGLIGFVGLVAPHLVRRSVTVTHRTLLWLAAMVGGVLLLAADVVARLAWAPQELPVGLLTVVFGGTYLLALLYRQTPESPA